MKKLITTTTLCVLLATATSYARTSWMNFNQDVNDADVWTSIVEKTSNGQAELETMKTSWTNQIGLSGGNYNVSLTLSNNFIDAYPYPENQSSEGINFIIKNLTFKVVSGGTLGLRIGTAATDFTTSTGCGVLGFEAPGVLEVSGTGRVFANDLEMVRNDSEQKVIVKDNAYFFTRGTSRIGSATDTKAKVVSFQGSNIEMAHLRNLRLCGSQDTSLDDVKGGKLEWIADANGISTVSHESTPQETITGIISVDFSKLAWNEAWGESKTFTLLDCTGTSNYLTDWVTNSSSTLGEIIASSGRITDSELAYFSADKSKLFVTIAKTAVPEPSTYAAIFGALALGFVAYRRRN